MCSDNSLKDLYYDFSDGKIDEIHTYPAIRYEYKHSDYLFLLYKDFIESESIPVHTIGFFGELKLIWSALRGKSCVAHYHWMPVNNWKEVPGKLVQLALVALYSKFGGTLFWTIHQKKSPRSKVRGIEYRVNRWMAKLSDCTLTHCESVIDDVKEYYKIHDVTVKSFPHPRYPSKQIPRNEAIGELNKKFNLHFNEDDQIFLMFGNINPLKQIKEVCQLFSDLDDDKKLLVAGPVKQGCLSYYRSIQKFEKATRNVTILPEFIKEDDVPIFHNAADMALFNYDDVLVSGGAELAKSYKVPIIAPKKGCLKELNSDIATLFDSQNELKSILKSVTVNNKPIEK